MPGAKRGEKGDGEESYKIGREPVGLAQSREDAVLDVLDPDIFVDTHSLENGVKTRQSGSGQDRDYKISNSFGLARKMSDQSIKKEDITKGRDQAAVKAGVVTPKTGVTVDTKNSGSNLGREK